MKVKLVAVFAIFVILSVSPALFFKLGELNGLNVKIDGSHALEIAKKDKKVNLFIIKNFKNPATRINDVFLKYSVSNQKYSWIVQFSERACACRGANKLNVAKVTIGPNDGKIIKYEFNKGIKESDLAKKSCMKACH
jgi:uncharacterized protein YpmB